MVCVLLYPLIIGMYITMNSSIARSRVPNGVAAQRLRVALPSDLLEIIKADADKNRRTISSMASLIIAEHYAAKLANR